VVKQRARILGVIGNERCKGRQSIYWPVYAYMDPAGELIQTRAWGSSGRPWWA